jgi:hypothetical protein
VSEDETTPEPEEPVIYGPDGFTPINQKAPF